MNNLNLNITGSNIDIDIVYNEEQVGYCCIDPLSRQLYNFHIYPQYQNKGFGTEALKLLINKYNIDVLDVYSDNKKAIHVYEKLGFKIDNYCKQLISMKRIKKDTISI